MDVFPGVVRNILVHREALSQIYLFLAASVLIAMVTAINIGLFMLSRAPGRRREIGIRFAVGASRRRIVRQLVSETGLLVGAAAVLGVVASLWLASLLQDLAFLRDVRWRQLTPFDWRRSEEHTSELQSRGQLVCRLLLEKKNFRRK